MLQKSICLLLLIFLLSVQTKAQDLPANRSIFIEGLGNGLIYSINYDARFGPGASGFGGRGGFGFMPVQAVNITSFPFVLNYLLGRNSHYFEFGVGAVILSVGAEGNDNITRRAFDRTTGIGTTLSIGYRYQPENGGLMLRAGLAPIFDSVGMLPFWPQASLGYAF